MRAKLFAYVTYGFEVFRGPEMTVFESSNGAQVTLTVLRMELEYLSG